MRWQTHTHTDAASTHLSLTLVPHHLSKLELDKVHEEGLGEVLEGVGCCQVGDQTPLLGQKHNELEASRQPQAVESQEGRDWFDLVSKSQTEWIPQNHK